jgi:hypothetical protein
VRPSPWSSRWLTNMPLAPGLVASTTSLVPLPNMCSRAGPAIASVRSLSVGVPRVMGWTSEMTPLGIGEAAVGFSPRCSPPGGYSARVEGGRTFTENPRP